MITRQNRERMQEYLVDKLSGSYKTVKNKSNIFTSDIRTNYITLDDNGIVLLVDKEYPRDSYREHNLTSFQIIYEKAKREKEHVGVVVYKDPETFFRSAAAHKHKNNGQFGSSRYGAKDLHNILWFRPEERFLFDKNKTLQYYQPKSQRLEECLATYTYAPITAFYSGTTNKRGYTFPLITYKLDHRITNETKTSQNLILQNGLLVPNHALCSDEAIMLPADMRAAASTM